MSLRTFHLVFILLAIVMADVFGAWAVWEHSHSGEGLTLALGIFSFLAGFGLIGYGIWFVRKLNRAKIE